MALIKQEYIDDSFIQRFTLTSTDTPDMISHKIYQFRNILPQFSLSKQIIMTELLAVIQPIVTQLRHSHFIEHTGYYHYLLKNLGKPDREFLQKASKTTPNISSDLLKSYQDYYEAIQKQLKLHLRPESETIAGLGIVTTVFGVFSYLISDNPWFSGGLMLLGAVEWSRNEDLVQLPEWTLIPGIARSTAALFHPIRRQEKALEYRLLNDAPMIQRL